MRFEEQQILDGIARLREKGHSFEHGLTDAEFADIESRFGFQFPPDLRFFLECALPTSQSFVNWRGDHNELQSRFWQIGMKIGATHLDGMKIGATHLDKGWVVVKAGASLIPKETWRCPD